MLLKITPEYLEELINFESSKLVGKAMKRFEILGERDSIKKELKELIYESFRDIRDLIIAHNKGLDITVFEFKQPKV
jgi:uncharacterized protein with HEPN domain